MPVSELPEAGVLREIGDGVRSALADVAVGAYLHGSTALARLRPRSDLDVLVVTTGPLDVPQRRTLTDWLLANSGVYPPAGGGRRPIELSVVTQSEVKPWRYPPTCDFLYGEWLRSEIESGELPAPVECPDLAILVTMARNCNAGLFGPPATEVLDQVPSGDLVQSATHGVPGLIDDLQSDTTNVVLTLARAWRTCATSDIVPKDAAAEWAMQRLPERRAVLDHARAVYTGTEEEDWAPLSDQLDATAHDLVAAIHRATDAPSAVERNQSEG